MSRCIAEMLLRLVGGPGVGNRPDRRTCAANALVVGRTRTGGGGKGKAREAALFEGGAGLEGGRCGGGGGGGSSSLLPPVKPSCPDTISTEIRDRMQWIAL